MTDDQREAEARMQHAALRGVTFSPPPRVVIGNADRLWPEELNWFRLHRDAVIRALTPQPEPAPPLLKAAPEPDPHVWMFFLDREVTEADVVDCLTSLGDDELARYRSGALTKSVAFRMARDWLRQLWQLERAELRRARGR